VNRRSVTLAGAFLAVLLAAMSCSPDEGRTATPSTTPVATDPSRSPTTGELTVYGAASLRDALSAIKTAYEAIAPGITLTIATDSSATLRAQIEQGAPADLFLSADERNPQTLVETGLADGDAVGFATNALTIVVPSGNPAGIAGAEDLATPGVKIVAAGDDVPISGYARDVVARLAGLDGYPAGFAAAYAANVVSREENVRAVLAKVELGEADAAIVYVTDARSSELARAIDIPPEANVAPVYAGVVVKTSLHAAEAHALLDWLAGPAGAAILATFGFGSPP
jgi:molybdate transport system substrate-binding protein